MAQRRKSGRRRNSSRQSHDPMTGVIITQVLLCGLLLWMSHYADTTDNPIAAQANQQVMALIDEPISSVFLPSDSQPVSFDYRYSDVFFGAIQKANLPQGGLFSVWEPKEEDGLLKAPQTASLSPLAISGAVLPPVEGVITSPFGYRWHPLTEMLDFHTGIDIAAPQNTPIRAALPGQVEETGESPIYGNYVILNHGGGLQTRYCHCETVTASPGANLRQGEQVALVGSTGISTGYHLHFEVILDGVVYDPLWVLEGVVAK